MSENNSQIAESPIEVTQGMFEKVKTFATSKKGFYLIGAILLIGAIYYYTQCYKKTDKTKKKSKKESKHSTEETEIPEPPPGYVTVPVEMLQGLQQDQMYQEVPHEMNNQMQQLPPQHQQQMQEQQRPPELKHNQRLEEEEEEEEEIANQDLSKADMASIQAQLNAMQREGSSA